MAFVEAPGIVLRDPGFPEFLEGIIHRVVGAFQDRGERDIERISLFFHEDARFVGFFDSVFGEFDVRPAGEEVFEVPFTLAVANQD